MKRLSVTVGCIALLLVSIAAAPARAPAREAAAGRGEFSDPLNIDNRYMPLVPGTTFIYEGKEDKKSTHQEFTVTNETKSIQGVETRVVHDVVWTNGKITEDTFDWFAQDDAGNVWYFGEASREIKNGKVVSREGSWQAGVDGAKAGIVMEANPRVGDKYPQENAPGIAEDRAVVVKVNASLCVGYGCFTNVLVTKETSPLDPGVVEKKYYAQGIGQIKSLVTVGGDEFSELVSVVTQ